MEKVIAKADALQDELEECADYLTSAGASAMAAVRECADRLEVMVDDEGWPLPRYREMLFPV
jgi:glutamine synthetase